MLALGWTGRPAWNTVRSAVGLSLTQILGKVFHDDILDDVRISATLPKPLKAGEVSMETLLYVASAGRNESCTYR
jgi:hypothetical protein